jgi:hypothetical protein
MVSKADSSADEALQIVFRVWRERMDARSADDSELVEALTESLVKDVFSVAWRHQFEDDRGEAQREIRNVVSEAVAQVVRDED